jgi:hypothetical protein
MAGEERRKIPKYRIMQEAQPPYHPEAARRARLHTNSQSPGGEERFLHIVE